VSNTSKLPVTGVASGETV